MAPTLAHVLTTVFGVLCLDATYLYLNRRMYGNQLKTVNTRGTDGEKPMDFRKSFPLFLIVWALMIISILYVVLPLSDYDPLDSLLNGFMVGALIYGIYNLTNLATIRDWYLTTVLVHTAWGTFLTGTVAATAAWTATW